MWLVEVHFTCLMISSVLHYYTVSTFHHHNCFIVTNCFKNQTFSLCLSRELHAEMQSRKFFLLSLCGTHREGNGNPLQCSYLENPRDGVVQSWTQQKWLSSSSNSSIMWNPSENPSEKCKCPTLCDSMGCSPPGSSVHGILQARILEWVAIPFSRDLLNPGMEPMSPALAGFFTIEPQGKPMWNPNIKAINITQLVQIIFNAWSGYFEYVGYLPHGTPFIVLNYYLNLITINFRWSPDVEQEISNLKIHKPLLTHLISHSNFSIHCTNLFFFFLHFSWVFNLPWSNEA